MVVPSAEVTVLMGSTFLAVVLRRTQDLKKPSGSWDSYGRRHSAHFEVLVESLGPASTSQTEAPVSAGVPKPSVGRDGESCRKPVRMGVASPAGSDSP
jgi:hypothetical protein